MRNTETPGAPRTSVPDRVGSVYCPLRIGTQPSCSGRAAPFPRALAPKRGPDRRHPLAPRAGSGAPLGARAPPRTLSPPDPPRVRRARPEREAQRSLRPRRGPRSGPGGALRAGGRGRAPSGGRPGQWPRRRETSRGTRARPGGPEPTRGRGTAGCRTVRRRTRGGRTASVDPARTAPPPSAPPASPSYCSSLLILPLLLPPPERDVSGLAAAATSGATGLRRGGGLSRSDSGLSGVRPPPLPRRPLPRGRLQGGLPSPAPPSRPTLAPPYDPH